MAKEKLYIGAKIIKGVSMDENAFLKDVKGEKVSKRTTRLGYKVTYPDGYVGWSPKKTFESAYRTVTTAEKELL